MRSRVERLLETAKTLTGIHKHTYGPAALIAAALLQVAEAIEKGQAPDPSARPLFPETTHEAQG